MDPAITTMIGTIAGTIIGAIIGAGIVSFSEYVKGNLAHMRELENLRVALYNELIISYEKLEGALLDFSVYIKSKDMAMLKSTNKLKYSDPLTFPIYDDIKLKPIFYELQESALKLTPAYFRLSAVNRAINDFSLYSL